MARTTLSARIDTLETTLERLVAALETAPAKSAPAQAKAEAPLYVSDRPRCGIHTARECTRKLSDPTTPHVACNGTGATHAQLRKTHRHF